MAKLYGYMRISSKSQNQDRQLVELLDNGVLQENIFFDIASGKDFNREQYLKLRTRLAKGDLLIIKSIDRLGRNYDDILQEWREITKNVGADIKVIDIPLLDTTSKSNDLTGVFISNLVLQILSYVAQQERENIKQRQKEGIALAKAKGKHLGRPKMKYPRNFKTVYADWKNGAITSSEAIKRLNMKKSTFYKMIHKYELSSTTENE